MNLRAFRPVFIALFLVAVFYVATTYRHVPFDVPGAKGSDKGKVEVIEAADAPPLDPEEVNNVNIYKKVLPSVVNITTRAMAWDFFYGPVSQEGLGSGFLVDRDGHILTNYHVVANARQLEVTLYNRRKYKAAVIGADPAHDLAVIQITGRDLQPVTLGDSKKLEVGQKVYAIGNPFGLSGTMTRGIVSSMRSIMGPTGLPIDDAIQTDAAINPGNSGGPLLNSRGEVIGINSQIATGGAEQSAGIGFAIPINTVKAVLNDLVTEGKVRRPMLGVRGFPVSAEISEQLGLPVDYGVLITQVVPGGSAEGAGLRGGDHRATIGNATVLLGGDLIIAIDGTEITDNRDLAAVMNNHRVGDKVKITYYRGKKKMEAEAVLRDLKDTA